MKKEIMIFLSIAIGAGIGGLLSIEFQLPLNLNLLFILLGGAVGYMIYEYEAVIEAVPPAYARTLETLGGIDYAKKIKTFIRVFFALLIGGMYLIPFFWLLFFGGREYNTILDVLMFPFLITVFVNEITLIIFFGGEFQRSKRSSFEFINKIEMYKILDKSKDGWLQLFFINLFAPIIGVYFLLTWLILSILEVFKFIKNNKKFVFVFITKLLKAIHSEERILVGTYAVAGGFIAYFFGNIILGMISGGVLGVITYRLITLRVYKTKET